MTLFLTITKAFYGFCAVFIACELGQNLSKAFNGISSKVEQLDWYLLPPQSKRILLIIIAVSDEPVTLECFGSISLSRDVFGRVSQFSKLIEHAYNVEIFFLLFRLLIKHFRTLCSFDESSNDGNHVQIT